MYRPARVWLGLTLRAAVLVGVVFLMAGCNRPAGNSGGSAAPVASASPSAAPTPAVTSIPDAAMLQQADIGGGRMLPAGTLPVPLSPCFKPVVKSLSGVTARREVTVTFRYTDNRDNANRPIEDGNGSEAILAFPPGGASAYLTELRDHLDQCATLDLGDQTTWRNDVVGQGFAGDESLMWQRTTTQIESSGIVYTENTLVAVVRFGDVAMVVDAYGNKIDLTAKSRKMLVDRALVDRLVAAAVKRVAVLRR